MSVGIESVFLCLVNVRNFVSDSCRTIEIVMGKL